MTIFEMFLITATLLCCLVAGLLLSFAMVVMPGLKRLDDAGFVRGFRAIDRVIQDGHPLFMLVWVGSLVSLIVATAMGWSRLDGPWLSVLIATTAVYLLGVHAPTVVVNIPLNNRLQALSVDELSPEEFRTARREFENRWNRWNVSRTVVSVLVSLVLIASLPYL